jgi:hypothetical protein
MKVTGIMSMIGIYAQTLGKRQYYKQLEDGSQHKISRYEFYKIKKANGWGKEELNRQ